VVNRAVVTGLDGKTATATDAGSIATYFIQTTSITNSLLHEQTSIDDAADYLLKPRARTALHVRGNQVPDADHSPKRHPGNRGHWRHDQRRKDVCQRYRHNPVGARAVVEGIEHYLDFSTGHRVLYSTAPTTIVYELILDDAIYGVLDALNVLG
jgi:hypothetical protein